MAVNFFDLKFQYQLSLLVISISTALLGSIALVKSKRSNVTFFYFLWTSCISLWAVSLFVSTLCSDPAGAKIWSHILHLFAILLPVVYLHFIYSFSGTVSGNEKKILIVLYGVVVVLVAISLLPDFLDVEYVGKFNFFVTLPRFLYPIHVVEFIGIILFATVVLFVRYAKDRTSKKRQYLLLLIGAGVGYSGGITNYLINYNIKFFPLYPFGNYTIFFYVTMISIAIIRYRFLDIDVIIRRTVVFTGLLTFVFGAFSTATFLVQEVLYRLGAGKTWTYAISLFVIVVGYDPIRNSLVNLTDKYLFQKKYDYQKLLKDATRGMSKIESLHHLLGLVVHFITMKMRVKNTSIMMRRRDNEFELGFQRGYSRNFLDYRLDDTNPMIMYLMREKEALDLDHVKEFIEAGNKKIVKGEKTPHEYDFEAIRLTMEELESSCVVPSFLGHDLRSILLVGEKKSGHLFTPDDVTLLFTLAQESAIAIENAKLFDEAINKSNQLAKINEQLEYSRNLLMKALRETEIANKQLQDTQAQLIHEQKMATLGRLAASVGHEVNNPLTILSMNVSRAILKYRKNPDLKVAEVLELFQKMEQNIGRIKAVVNTLTGLLKKSEKGKFEPLSLKLILEETLPLVQFQTYLDNLSGTEVEFDIPGNTPLIRGDLERLQEVFLNLFINAYHAMQGRRNRRIRVTAELDTENPARVAVNFMDNGCGMTEEIMKKIFNYGFTTKPPGRGSGMGLYMCKYIVELHGGDMKVGSKVGEGTTFTIYLPAYEEGAGESGLRIEASS